MQTLAQDIRYALRQLRKAPGFTLTAIVTLALGLGATTAIVAVVDSVLVRPLPIHDAGQLMMVGVSDKNDAGQQMSWLNYKSLQRDLPAFSALVAYYELPTPASVTNVNTVVLNFGTTTNFFDALMVKPALGRTFQPSDEGADRVVISDAFWRNEMHADSAVVGKTIRMLDRNFTVVGVMPRSFQFPITTADESVWTTLVLDNEMKTKRGFSFIQVFGRLRPGVSQAAAVAQGESLVRHSRDLNEGSAGIHFRLFPYLNTVVGDQRPALFAMLAGCLVLLLIACVNIANLQIARANSREGEMSLRSALGANRRRIVQQMLVESVLISVAGGAAGFVLAQGALHFIRTSYQSFARFDQISLDAQTYAVCFAIAVACGIFAGLAPALRLMRTSPSTSLQQSGAGSYSVTRRNRLSTILVACEVALTFVLLVAGGLFLRTLQSLEHVPLGFDAQHVSTFLLWPQNGHEAVTTQAQTYGQLLQRLEHAPGIQSAGLVTALPISNFGMRIGGSFKMAGRPENKDDRVQFSAVSPDYFKTMGIPVTRGRGLVERDTLSAEPVVVVNEAFAREYYSGKSPLGQQFLPDADAGTPTLTIVGVVGDTVEGQVSQSGSPFAFFSYRQLPPAAAISHFMIGIAGQFAVRSTTGQAPLERTLREIVKQEAPTYAIDHLVPMQNAVDDSLTNRRLALRLAMSFGLLALILAAVGVQGVLAYLVSQRIREIGIRIALGATRKQVLGGFLRHGMRLVLYGLAGGVIISLIAARWLKSFLFGVPANDIITFIVVGTTVLVVALLATYIPARRASSIDPMQALRNQ